MEFKEKSTRNLKEKHSEFFKRVFKDSYHRPKCNTLYTSFPKSEKTL
jgi:hypothetical protein